MGQNLLFLSAWIFLTYIFQIAFRDFQQESSFLALLMVEKGHGLLFSSKTGKGLFLTSKNGQGTFLTSNFWLRRCCALRKTQTWTLLNFVKSPFFSYWILWRVRFPHIEFREESVFLMLNFVKCPKTHSVSPLDRPLHKHMSFKFIIFVSYYCFMLFQKICLNFQFFFPNTPSPL